MTNKIQTFDPIISAACGGSVECGMCAAALLVGSVSRRQAEPPQWVGAVQPDLKADVCIQLG